MEERRTIISFSSLTGGYLLDFLTLFSSFLTVCVFLRKLFRHILEIHRTYR